MTADLDDRRITQDGLDFLREINRFLLVRQENDVASVGGESCDETCQCCVYSHETRLTDFGTDLEEEFVILQDLHMGE